jgi:hypothetical protein
MLPLEGFSIIAHCIPAERQQQSLYVFYPHYVPMEHQCLASFNWNNTAAPSGQHVGSSGK